MNHADCSRLQLPWAAREDVAATASPPLIIRTCNHLLESGAFCQAATVAGRSYCRAHLLLRVRCRKMVRARRRAGLLRLPSLVDLQSVRKAKIQVRVALAAGHIDPQLAGLLSYAMRQATTNLRFMAQQEKLALGDNSAHGSVKRGSPWRAAKSKRHYRIRITSGESSIYDRNTS